MEYKGTQTHVSGGWDTIITAAAGKVNIVKLIQATNVTGSLTSIEVAISGSGTEDRFYLAKDVGIASKASYVVVDDPVVLESGTHLQAKASIHEGLDLVVSYMQASSSIV